MSPSPADRDVGAHLARRGRGAGRRAGWWRRPVADGDRAAGDHGGARNGAALDRSGSTTVVDGADRAGCDPPQRRVSSRRPRRRVRAAWPRSCRCAAATARACRRAGRRSPASNRAPASSRAETNCEDADASTVTVPPGTAPVPWTVNGSAPRPSSSMATPRARSAATTSPTGRDARVRVAVERDVARRRGRDRRDEPHHRAGEPAVDGGVAGRSGPGSPTSRRWTVSAASAQRAQRRGHQQGVAGPERRGGRRLGPSDSAASTSARLVSDLVPGRGTTASTGPSAVGAGQGSVRRRRVTGPLHRGRGSDGRRAPGRP